MTQSAASHGVVTRGIHWLSAALIGYGYIKGLDSLSQLADPAVLQFEVGFALILGLLFLVRLIWTKGVAGATRLPQDAPSWEKRTSRLVHAGLYASVFGIVLSGLAIALGTVVPWLGVGFVAVSLAVHEVSLIALPALLATHIAGALWHKLVRKDQVLESMTGRLPL